MRNNHLHWRSFLEDRHVSHQSLGNKEQRLGGATPSDNASTGSREAGGGDSGGAGKLAPTTDGKTTSFAGGAAPLELGHKG
jgi:hypothetical protein